MFNRFHKIIAYTLIMSLLAGSCAVPAMAADANEGQSVPAETVQEETHESSDSDGGSDNNGSGNNGSDNSGSDDGESDDENDASDVYDDNSGVSQNVNSDDDKGSQVADDDGDSDGYRDEDEGEGAEQGYGEEGSNDGESGLTNSEHDEYDINFSDEGDTGDGQGGWYDADGNWYGNGQIGYYDESGHWYEGWFDSDGNWHDVESDSGNDNAGFSGEGNTGDGQNGGYDADGNWNNGTAHSEYTIEKRPQTVTGRPSYTKHFGDDLFRLEVATDGDGTLLFSSSNERVIDMSHTGRAYIKGTGTAVISIFAVETETCKKSNLLRVTITVLKKQQKLTGATSYTKSLETDPFDIKVTKEGNGPLIYESSNKNVATVSRSGKVTIKGVGSAKITVYAAETATCMESTAKTITVKVGPKKTELTGIVSGADNKATVVWEKQEGVSGYQVQYSADENFAKGEIVTAGASKTSAVINGLTDEHYVRIRAYKTQSGKKLYAEWSDAESVGAKIASPAGSGRIGAALTGAASIGAARIGSASIGTLGIGGRIGALTGIADLSDENTFSTLVQELWASEWQTSDWCAAVQRATGAGALARPTGGGAFARRQPRHR